MEKTMEMQNVLTHIRACENLCVVREFLSAASRRVSEREENKCAESVRKSVIF